MGRFRAVTETETNAAVAQNQGNYPFNVLYGTKERDMLYINLEAVKKIATKMTTKRDMYIIVDMSGSIEGYYEPRRETVVEKSGFLGIGRKTSVVEQASEMESMLTTIIDSVADFDDDGVDVLFFSSRMVHQANVKSASEVKGAIEAAKRASGSFRSTMPTSSFEEVIKQMREKKRPGTVFFLTDGELDDKGDSLVKLYKNTLHTEFKTREQFYCYAIEFGTEAEGALEKLDGLYLPDQGPEDLFDHEQASNLDAITAVLTQVGKMSVVGSDDMVHMSVSGGVIDMVNTKLYQGGVSSASETANQIMSIRVRANAPFEMTVKMAGYEDMTLVCTPEQYKLNVQIKSPVR